jgi:hypothetical protein
LDRDAALAAWPDIADAAKAPRPGVDLDVIHKRLAETTLQAWRVSGKASGWVLTSVAKIKGSGQLGLWIYLAGGKAGGFGGFRGVVTFLEGVARTLECAEIRAEVYRLSILRLMPPGWEQAGVAGGRYLLRKELTNARR